MASEMQSAEDTNLQLVRRYLGAIQSGEVGEALSGLFTADVIQVEFPNRLNPSGQQSDLASIISRSIQGKHILSSQRYEVVSEVVQGNRVAVEALWVGTLAAAVGPLNAGTELRAHFAMFFECRDGRIRRQHNYDCFEPW
jgi:ketosteroid isomerase-like protein